MFHDRLAEKQLVLISMDNGVNQKHGYKIEEQEQHRKMILKI